MDPDFDDVRASYDRIAEAYAERYATELRHKPLDRALLQVVADESDPRLPVADVGCGPGHVAQYLHDRGVRVVGVDISPGMVAVARRLHPGLAFREGSLLALGVDDCAWGAIVAFYSIIHLPDGSLPDAMRECARALCDGGSLLASFHVGHEVLHRDEMLGLPVSLDFHLLQMRDVVTACEGAGFSVEMTMRRRPHLDIEAPTTRGYLLARKALPAG